ncbi:hypothetical protein [Planomonospora sp. ID82291]|uniref:hypothetical protein n=1 Tax=Planomonospora sp. ID82291 TaxID=2738136 RepID=UPI0018C3D5CA|nr:hypothetical protein [Planomonospora sp. ID82291]MBG0818747.1 hypothetical protein [Planomonospora sp. ID82291]
MRQLATPGTEFVDLVWGDNEPGQEMEPADPAELFADPGEHFSYVVVARPLVACIYLPGTVRTSHRLFATAGRRIGRHAAQKITDDLTKARAVQAAT